MAAGATFAPLELWAGGMGIHWTTNLMQGVIVASQPPSPTLPGHIGILLRLFNDSNPH
jgi:hypothetical protein